MNNFLIKKNQEIVQVKALYPLSSLLLDAYSVNFRYFGSPGNSSRHSTHNGAQNFEKLMYDMMHSFVFMGYFHKYFQLHQRIIIID